MGKPRAQIQREYRERKKLRDGRDYLQKETQRVKGYYKPSSEIGPNKLKVRRERVKLCMQKRRAAVKVQRTERERVSTEVQAADQVHVIIEDEETGPCDSTTQQDINIQGSSQMIVDMKFGKGRGSLKQSEKFKKKVNEIKSLTLKLDSLKKRNDKLRKILARGSTSQTPATPSSEPKSKREIEKRKLSESKSLTPRSTSFEALVSEGLSPAKHPKLVKQLTLHNSIVDEVKEKIKRDRGRARQRKALQIVCGEVLKRYRMCSKSSYELGVNRGQINKTNTGKQVQKRRKALEREQTARAVRRFLTRDDNSTCLPGKKDKTKTENGTAQTRMLNDYMYNLHMEFNCENANIKVGFTTFCSYRPKEIKLVHFTSRRTCLCQTYQNMALKVKGLKTAGITTTENPDTLIKTNTDEEIIQQIRCSTSGSTINYAQWKRKEVEHKGCKTKRMLIENVECPKSEFIDQFSIDLVGFREHTERVRIQYQQIKMLKDKMPADHAICQMDFAENYSCGHADEIQTAYFDKCSVTLHPVVLYTKSIEGEISHASYIYVSDTPAHNSGTVYAFVKRITAGLKSKRTDIDTIHYVTDSPTSQYRNKSMIYLIANHDEIFDMKASWQYREAGHGKGACDGVGGTSKRLADLAVKRQTAIIQSAEDYYNWGNSLNNSQTKYFFVPQNECDQAQTELLSMNTKPIKGTLAIHSVVHVQHGEVAVRNTSCFCENCFENGHFKIRCAGWNKHSVIQAGSTTETTSSENQVQSRIQSGATVETSSEHQVASVMTDTSDSDITRENTFVAAIYNDEWYIGKIVEYDPDDDDNLCFHISFMDHGKGKGCYTFKWPAKEDKIWRAKSDILCSVNEPIQFGSRKLFKLSESDVQKILTRFEDGTYA